MDLLKLKGIGPAVIKKLEKLSVLNAKDLIYHFPSRYIDRRKELKIADLHMINDDNWHSIGFIRKLSTFRIRGGRMIVNGAIEDDTGMIKVQWFNNPYLMSNIKNDDKVVFSGKPEKGKLTNPKIKKVLSDQDVLDFGKIEAIYPETKGLKSYQISKLVLNALESEWFRNLKENLPKKILQEEKLIARSNAIRIIHFPPSLDEVKVAQERIAFEEIFYILKLIKRRKSKLKKFKAYPNTINETAQNELESKLSFALTESQKKAISEIFDDLKKQNPMHRLLNGDVGSGKTIVALSAAFQVLNNNRQVIFLAPTAVLANQHYNMTKSLLTEYGVQIHLVTSDTRSEINKLKAELNDSENQEIFIGTHALLYHTELFNNIGLVIIDEQHKFGVKQREMLENFMHSSINEKIPHVLSMSATPIPRSLALTIFGDLEVSILAKPQERKKIITRVIYDEDTQEKMYAWIRNEIKINKSQVYVVCPLIQDSEVLDTKSAITEFENLTKKFPEFNVEILHGKIKSKEKEAILNRFKQKEVDILVSTSVIEVGIDNPNATIMIIEGAERFGLAQLHQIRGRVGRSEKQSYCFLKSTGNFEDERLNFFAGENDGFKIAEFDLQKRGPGEVYGEAQSGIPNLKVAKITDIELIQRVKKYFK